MVSSVAPQQQRRTQHPIVGVSEVRRVRSVAVSVRQYRPRERRNASMTKRPNMLQDNDTSRLGRRQESGR